jgi:4-hydroxybenzoate polyprenyltransferase
MKILPFLKLMRVDRPIGFFLLMWPTLWSLWLASNFRPSLKMIMIFVAGVIVMRAAGCVINDIADRNFDGHVERTKNRPLARQEVSVRSAIILLIVLFAIALFLVLQLNAFCFWLAVIMGSLTILYPFCKRFTYLPQILLGMIFNGTLFPFAATQNHLSLLAWVIYLSTLTWAVAYDTMYAMTDQADDKKLGLKSTALLFGTRAPTIVALLQSLFILGLIGVGTIAQLTWPYWLSLLFAMCLMIYQQTLIRQSAKQGLAAFLNNNWIGLLIFIGLVVSPYT